MIKFQGSIKKILNNNLFKASLISFFLFRNYSKIIHVLKFCLSLINNSKKREKKKYIKNQKVGISFGATGGLFMYSHGVAKYLQENYNLNDVVFAGTSGGCQASYFLASEINLDIALEKWLKPWVNDMNQINRQYFYYKFLPKFCFLTESMRISKRHLGKIGMENNKIYGIKKFSVNMMDIVNLKQISVSDWRSFDDICFALQATQYIPFIFGFPFSIFRNKWCIDGFFIDKNYEPDKDIYWIHINPFKWQKRSFINGILSLNKFDDINFHIEERNKGYFDAKKNKNIFDILPQK